MLKLSNIELYFFNHFSLYHRDEETDLSQKTGPQSCSYHSAGPNQNDRSKSGSRFCRQLGAALDQIAAQPAGAHFGFSPPQTQKADPHLVRSRGLSAGHTGDGFLSSLGGPHRAAGRMHAEQAS